VASWSSDRLTCRRPVRPVDSAVALTPAPQCHFVTNGNAYPRQGYESAGRKHFRYLLLQRRHFGQRIANNVRSLTDWIRPVYGLDRDACRQKLKSSLP